MQPPPAQSGDSSESRIVVRLTVNESAQQVAIEPWVTLLDLLRERLGITGPKKGCDHGQCGGCTVLVNGRRLNSCLLLAVAHDGAEITTVEGLGASDALSPLQQAFIERDAFQCGYCTPGQLCSAMGLLAEGQARTRDDIRELMSGNICRCGAYTNIVDAIEDVMHATRRDARMRRFEYVRAATLAEALAALTEPDTSLLAGGTNLVDLMKYDVARPRRVVDIGRLPLQSIDELPDGGLRIGALVPNADAAYDARVQARAPLVASAILAGASPQLRNAATTGGNLLQRTRCFYFYDTGTPCNKREPGTGCSAIGGVTRMHAILGTSDRCIATHPSDMCVALAALRASVLVTGPSGDRVIPFAEFHRLPGNRPEIDTTLARDEIIVGVETPAWRYGKHYSYLKVRDRLSYAFALVSAATALEIDDGRITSARIALGGVAHKPWQSADAEIALTGKAPTRESFAIAADALLAGARGYGGNDFKIELARRTVVRALMQAAAGTPQSQSDKKVR